MIQISQVNVCIIVEAGGMKNNVQASVDSKNNLIVDWDVVNDINAKTAENVLKAYVPGQRKDEMFSDGNLKNYRIGQQ